MESVRVVSAGYQRRDYLGLARDHPEESGQPVNEELHDRGQLPELVPDGLGFVGEHLAAALAPGLPLRLSPEGGSCFLQVPEGCGPLLSGLPSLSLGHLYPAGVGEHFGFFDGGGN